MSKTIFITGASRGFGKLWAEALLKKGHKVIATARKKESLRHLEQQYGDRVLALTLDVADRDAVFASVQKAEDHFGSLDILINNAGFGLFGSVEETSEAQARQQMETNFFGLLWTTQAVLPIMRRKGHGHIIQVSSIVGLVTLPVLGVYNASKFAVEGLSETLATEVKPFGINVTLLEPGAYGTDWAGDSASHASPMPEYQPVKDAFFGNITNDYWGKPEATVDAVLQLVDNPQPPQRLLLGKYAYPMVKESYASRLAEWDQWKEVSAAAQG